MPFTTSSRRLLGRPYLEQIVFRVSDVARVSEAAEQVRALLRVQHGVQPGSPDDFFVREPDQVQDAALESSNTMAMLLIGLSLVAMVAGGVVIANVMVLSVSARAHEIGVRRAVGASAADISRQFLLEAAMVALAAALVGGLGGVLLAKLLSVLGVATSRVTALPFLATVVACGAVALVFGTQPARRAARIDPAATLRESRA
jgi:ABC-type antimicrobial peptide transport system permease subunit